MLFTTDQQTLTDLNIFGSNSEDSIYGIFNRTFTRGGSELLAEMFRYPLSDAESINNRSQIVQFFTSVSVFPFDVELLDIIEQYLVNNDERTKISPTGDQMNEKINNLIWNDANYKFIHKGTAAVIEIIRCFKVFIDGLSLSLENPFKDEAEQILTLLNDPHFSSLIIENFKGKLSYARLSEYDLTIRFRHREQIRKILKSIYNLDVYISVGKVAARYNFVFPKAYDPKIQQEIILEGVFHPQIEKPIGNNIYLNPLNNVVFLTGANMAGKSTFMKSIGIAMFLAHMGFPVPATKMDFCVVDGIYTTINLPDNLGTGTSHFYAEVLRIKKIAKELALNKRLFVIIDELFRGTNVKDAFEATVALTSAFAEKENAMFIISTHIIEAGAVLKSQCNPISFKYLPTQMRGSDPVYTYRLETGITADRHGMVIINNEGILDILKNGIKKS